MKVNFDKPILALDNEPIPNTSIGKQIANLLVSQSKGEVLKFYDWALKLYKGESLDLDRADQETLKNFVKDSDQITILLKAQFLQVFEPQTAIASTSVASANSADDDGTIPGSLPPKP